MGAQANAERTHVRALEAGFQPGACQEALALFDSDLLAFHRALSLSAQSPTSGLRALGRAAGSLSSVIRGALPDACSEQQAAPL
jgi:hypothetical protein